MGHDLDDGEVRVEYYWHIHHEVLIENVWDVYEGIEDRIHYIKIEKDPAEVPLRLHLMRPATDLPQSFLDYHAADTYDRPKYGDPVYEEMQEQLGELHTKQCDPQCPWEFTQPEADYYTHTVAGNILLDNYDKENKVYTLKDGTIPR